MKFIFFKTSFSFLAILICLSSCGQKTSHKDALNYCVTIQQQVAASKKAYDISFGEIKIQIKNAQQSDTKKIDKVIVDTLRKHFENFIEGLDKNIEILQSVKETDTEIDFKNKTLAYLNALKKLELMSMPQTFDLLENGLNTLTAKQKEDNKNVFIQSETVKNTNTDSQKAFLDYLKKYDIKDEELMKYGLAN
jgi:hypothetical protein